jgi:hypothetical protein
MNEEILPEEVKQDEPTKIETTKKGARKKGPDTAKNFTSETQPTPQPSTLSRRVIESSDDDEFPNPDQKATEWEIVVPSKQRALDEEVEKQLTALLEHYPANPIMPKS